jgi:8-amino-7-oxononanoate synthase
MRQEHWIDEELAELRNRHMLRSTVALPQAGGRINWNGRTFINFSSNDYLDFLHRPALIEAANHASLRYGTGSGASRLVTGNLAIHEELEEQLARGKGYPAGLTFGSGFLANLGVVTALIGRDGVVFADRLVHASLIDAIRLSGARLVRFRHNDMDDLAVRLRDNSAVGRRLIISESVYSMDGDLAPIDDLARLAVEYDAMLMIDEAHATGVFGPSGHGLIAEHQHQSSVNISMCTFSKALGGYGGGVACSTAMREWLINNARTFIYTTALPPSVCAAAVAALKLLDTEPHLGGLLLQRAERFRSALQERGFNVGASRSQIVPVIIGDNADALNLATAMRENGMLVTAIRPPTVPAGTARLRFSVTLAHTDDDLLHAADTLAACAQKVGKP